MKHWRIPLFELAVCLFAFLLIAGCTRNAGRGIRTNGLDEEDQVDYGLIGLGDRSNFKAVDMTYLGADEGNDPFEECTTVYPDTCVQADDASIWKDKVIYKGKPKKVRWWIDEGQQDLNYEWRITYKSGGDWLGSVDPIKCGKKKTKTKAEVAANAGGANDLNWYYEIEVWKCEGNAPKWCLCKTDPRVRIHN